MILNLSLNTILPSNAFDTLKEISYTKVDEFNSLIARISEHQSKNLNWWVERPSTRNTLQSPLYYRFCCLYLVRDLIQAGTSLDKVIVDSHAMLTVIRELKERKSYNFEIEGPAKGPPHFHNYFLKSLKPFFVSLKRLVMQLIASKKTKHLSPEPPKEDLILIDQFVLPGFITEQRYYNGLWDALSPQQKEKTFFVPTLVMMKEEEFEPAYRALRTSERNFLIKEDYLTFFDLLYSLFHIFLVWFIKPESEEVLGVDFSRLVREELIRAGYENAIIGLLNYHFARCLRKKSFSLSLVVDWWEGQPLDKGWNLGFHTFFPNTLRKGYIGYAPRTMELQLWPSDSEIKYGVAPPIIATIGNKFSIEMNATKQPFKAETAPAFRFGHLWGNGSISEKNSESFRILLALSIKVDESIRILEQVIDSGLIEDDQMKFILKPHPTVQFDTLKKRMGDNWSSRFQESENSTPEEIRSSDLLITGMSSVGLEAVVMGVPAIIVEILSGLAFDPIPESVPRDLWRSCRSSNEIFEIVNSFRNRTQEEVKQHQEMSAAIKNDYFEPVTEEAVQRFLNLQSN